MTNEKKIKANTKLVVLHDKALAKVAKKEKEEKEEAEKEKEKAKSSKE